MKFLPARVARLGARTARGSWIVLALVLASCSTNESGRIAATGTGDISNPPVTRIAPVANGAACANLPGEGAGQTAIARAPYLQRVTAHEAVVVWTSVAGASAETSRPFSRMRGQPPTSSSGARPEGSRGDVVNTTARLASAAAAGELLVRVEAAVEAEASTSGLERRTLEVRGREATIEVLVIRPA